jgi:hypothetical protein
MIKDLGKYLKISEKERKKYLQKLTYKESGAITEAMMSSKLLLELKSSSNRKRPCALYLTLRKGSLWKNRHLTNSMDRQ